MKKVILFSFVFVALALVTSCGNKSDANAEEIQNDTTAVDPTEAINDMNAMLDANNSEGFNEIVSATQEKIETLMKEGKVEEAQTYAAKLKEFIDENTEKIKSVAGNDETVNSILNTINSIPSEATGALKDLEEDVKGTVESTVEDAKEKVNEAVEDAKEKAQEAVEDAKEKANAAVEDAKQKANDAVDNAVEDAKQKANNAVNDAANKLKNKLKH